jgi:quercetin dioxygenase-like cupin family protein
MTSLLASFCDGTVACADGCVPSSDLTWNAHPAFHGVALKHLVPGRASGGRFSVHLVRVDGGCSLREHAHQENWELHQVVEGAGVCRFAGQSVTYAPGVCGVLPAGVAHEVQAGPDGLCLLAVFTPALV